MKHEIPPAEPAVTDKNEVPISEIAHKVRVKEAKIAHIESQEADTHPVDNLTEDDIETIVRRQNIHDGRGNTAPASDIAEAKENLQQTRRKFMNERVEVTREENEAEEVVKNLAYTESLTKSARGDRRAKRASGSRGTSGVFEPAPNKADEIAKRDKENDSVVEEVVAKDLETEKQQQDAINELENALTTRGDAVVSGVNFRASYKDQSLDTGINDIFDESKSTKRHARKIKREESESEAKNKTALEDVPVEKIPGTELPNTSKKVKKSRALNSTIHAVIEPTLEAVPEQTIPDLEIKKTTPEKKSGPTPEKPKKTKKTTSQIAQLAASYEAKRTKVAQNKEGIKNAPIDSKNILVPFSRVTNEEYNASELASTLAREELINRTQSEQSKEKRLEKTPRTPARSRASGSRSSRVNMSKPGEPDYGFAQYDQVVLSEEELDAQKIKKEEVGIVKETTTTQTIDQSEGTKKNIESFRKSKASRTDNKKAEETNNNKNTANIDGNKKNIEAFRKIQGNKLSEEKKTPKDATPIFGSVFGGAGFENKNVVSTPLKEAKVEKKVEQKTVQMTGKVENRPDVVIGGSGFGNMEIGINEEGEREFRELEPEHVESTKETAEGKTTKEQVPPNKENNSETEKTTPAADTTFKSEKEKLASNPQTNAEKIDKAISLESHKIGLLRGREPYDRVYQHRYSWYNPMGFSLKKLFTFNKESILGMDTRMIFGFPTLHKIFKTSSYKEYKKLSLEKGELGNKKAFDPKDYIDSFSGGINKLQTEINSLKVTRSDMYSEALKEYSELYSKREVLAREVGKKYALSYMGRQYFPATLKNPLSNPRLTDEEKQVFIKLSGLDELLAHQIDIHELIRTKKLPPKERSKFILQQALSIPFF
ncbi:MAG TPA: hypothetical protein PLF31_01975 [Candidatus Paceibacterota bacterium]|nr:hypothetical protein [Candidatus Paceibacterota bacterium]